MVNLDALHSKVKFICVFGTHGLEVTNMPGMAKILASNSTGTCFFLQPRNIPFQIPFHCLSAYVLSA